MKRTENGRRRARTAGGGGSETAVRIVRRGIARQGARAIVQPPLSDRHHAVMALLDSRAPRQGKEVAERLGLQAHQVQSALYVLQSRGLAEHLTNRRGWLLTQPGVDPATTR